MASAEYINFKGEEAVELRADKYVCLIAPKFGCKVVRLFDEKDSIEVFRYSESESLSETGCSEVWGLPSLYLPNRFDKGILKTSDCEYKLPVNETLLNNHIHGWVHKRPHKTLVIESDDQTETAKIKTVFSFDETDEMFEFFPLPFSVEYTFELSEMGLVQNVKIKNHAQKRLPVSFATHTCLSAQSFEEENLSIKIEVGDKCLLDERCLPNEKFDSNSQIAKDFCVGEVSPTLQKIDNEMFFAQKAELKDGYAYVCTISDKKSSKSIVNETSEEFLFWNIWNDGGFKGYFCPEPMTAMINAPNLSLPKDLTGYKELENGESFECRQRFFTK